MGTSPTPTTAATTVGAAATPRTPALDVRQGLDKLATYPFAILTFVDDAGYPVSVALSATIDPAGGTATFAAPAGLTVPTGIDVSLTGSHIRPQPGYGYDERRHVTVWGRAAQAGDRIAFTAARAWGWDEAEVPFFEYSERSVGQSKRYFDALTAERGTPVKPKLSFGWLALRTTRLPFLSATIVPVVLGIAIAARQGSFDLLTAVLTVIGAAFVQLGLNVANDVFDSAQGADEANVTPTQFSGGSRVIQYGLVSFRQMAGLATTFYVLGGVIGLVLLGLRGSTALLVIGIVGFIVSLGYTAPPLKFVYRGLGEIAVAIGFGPLMLLGGYVVQTRGALSWEPFVASLPVALLVALILYVNEIPDRRGDARVGKRTLPVRFSKAAVIGGYRGAAIAAYAILVAGVIAGLLPIPALLALLTIPLALQVSRGLEPNYDNPYGLMAIMGVNVKVHLYAGLLLLAGYAVVLILGAVAPSVSLFVGR
jgi:1,4-dihydroxy-2-naphthoate octaprenyltransferase